MRVIQKCLLSFELVPVTSSILLVLLVKVHLIILKNALQLILSGLMAFVSIVSGTLWWHFICLQLFVD